MGYKLSPSSLNLLEDCPRCFWLNIMKKISRPSGAFPSLPSGVDKILKEHFDSFMRKGKLPPELKHTNGYQLFKILKQLDLESVPIIDETYQLPNSIDELVKYATRKSLINPEIWAEGIVFRPVDEVIDLDFVNKLPGGRISFKAINPEFLLKYE